MLNDLGGSGFFAYHFLVGYHQENPDPHLMYHETEIVLLRPQTENARAGIRARNQNPDRVRGKRNRLIH